MNIKEIARENRFLIAKLKDEYFDTYVQIAVLMNLDEEMDISKEEVKNDIVNMLYEGQSRGAKPEEIVGTDLKKFGDEVLSERKEESKIFKKYYLLESFFSVISILLIVNAGFEIYKFGFTKSLSIGITYVTSLIIYFPFITYFTNKMASKSKWSRHEKKDKWIFVISLIFVSIIQGIINDLIKIKINVNIYIYIIIVLVFTGIWFLVNRKYKEEIKGKYDENKGNEKGK